MHINPYLNFDGRCAEAFEFYKRHIGAESMCLMAFRGQPGEQHAQEEWRDKIMHASMEIGGTSLMASDGMPAEPAAKMRACSITLHTDSDADAKRIFEALSQDGEVTMALGKTFWASSFGMLVDRFGVSWMVMHQGMQGGGAGQ